MGFCDDVTKSKSESIDKLNKINITISIVICSLCGVASLAASYFIFCRRRGEQRPGFVTV